MAQRVYELQGYAIVLSHVAFVTRVFEAGDEQGWQFNIRFASDVRLQPRFPTRSDAELQRSLLIQAIEQTAPSPP
jgi:hypothetical protein